MLDSGIQWLPPRIEDSRFGYSNIHHAGFVLGGARKQRGHAYLQLDSATAIPGNAVIADEHSLSHEWRDLRPHVPYRVPALTITDGEGPFWLDEQRGLSGEPLPAGSYLTDEAFINRVVRTRAPAGERRVRVKLVLGDSRRIRVFLSDWLPFRSA
jgi:hypothetical protein